MEGAVEELAGFVAREHAAGTIRSVGSGSQAEDQDTGLRIAEGRHGLAPIFVVEIGSALHLGDVAAMVAEAGAESAGDDFTLKNREFVHNDISTLAA